jgi:hypothetical protein
MHRVEEHMLAVLGAGFGLADLSQRNKVLLP